MTEIKIIPSVDPRLKRQIEHDPQSKLYPYKAVRGTAPVSKRHNRAVPIFDQGDLGSCTGNAAIGCLGTEPFYSTIIGNFQDFTESGAIQVYTEATRIDPFEGEYPPTDTGSSGLSVAKILAGRGLISGYRHAFTFDDLVGALQDTPVIIGIKWYGMFFQPDSNGIITTFDGDYSAGGHEFVVDEINFEKKLFGCTNSWGDGFGLAGRFFIAFDLMVKLLADQGDVTVFVPNTLPAPQPLPSTPVVGQEISTEADQAFWTDVKIWAKARHGGTNKVAAKRLNEWAKAKGLVQ